jgi:hypothetical protein
LISTDMLECRADHFNLTGWNPFDKAKTPRAEELFARTIVAASQQRQSLRRSRRLFGDRANPTFATDQMFAYAHPVNRCA